MARGRRGVHGGWFEIVVGPRFGGGKWLDASARCGEGEFSREGKKLW